MLTCLWHSIALLYLDFHKYRIKPWTSSHLYK